MKAIIWSGWVTLTLALTGYFSYQLLASDDKSDFLIGDASHGHHQIELACDSCHTSPFGGKDVLQDACVNCHGEELAEAFDAHPKKKFTDPREADRLKLIDARYCVSCHTEHQKEITHSMGVSLPEDYCFHCHQSIGEDRTSHKDLAFDSCASAGCHNFHDNRALYERFLVANANQPWVKTIAQLAEPNSYKIQQSAFLKNVADIVEASQNYPEISKQWSTSAHAAAEVHCGHCHSPKNTKKINATTDNNIVETTGEQSSPQQWIEKPNHNQCRQCHDKETEGFTSGKHGMRLSTKLSTPFEQAITPRQAVLTFNSENLDQPHSCNACHNVHQTNTQTAAVESCLKCHNDQHSQAYLDSPHGKLWQQEIAGLIEKNTGVSCASCHMPRVIDGKHKDQAIVRVEHNQNLNLRPNEKMIRPVCMQCHGLAFSIDALADPQLIDNNFNGQPTKHIPSIDWALKRDQRK